MRIDSITHFTDEIGVVEISTFRDEMIIVLPPYFKVSAVSVLSPEQTVVSIQKLGTKEEANEETPTHPAGEEGHDGG